MARNKNAWVDPDRAFAERRFARTDEAGVSAYILGKSAEYGRGLFLFLSDTALQPDNRITQYQRISGRLEVAAMLGTKPVLLEGFESFDDGLLFWAVCHVSEANLLAVVHHVRLNRGSFLFYAAGVPAAEEPFADLICQRGQGGPSEIDHLGAVQRMVRHGYHPIRIWGPPGERDLWVEIYATDPDPSLR